MSSAAVLAVEGFVLVALAWKGIREFVRSEATHLVVCGSPMTEGKISPKSFSSSCTDCTARCQGPE